jgi:hypothetical protein
VERRGAMVVRRRSDGIPQIIRVRPNGRLALDRYGWSLALGFVAVALYVVTLAPAAAVVLLAAVCTAVDAYRRAAPAGPARRGDGSVVPLPLTASRR